MSHSNDILGPHHSRAVRLWLARPLVDVVAALTLMAVLAGRGWSTSSTSLPACVAIAAGGLAVAWFSILRLSVRLKNKPLPGFPHGVPTSTVHGLVVVSAQGIVIALAGFVAVVIGGTGWALLAPTLLLVTSGGVRGAIYAREALRTLNRS